MSGRGSGKMLTVVDVDDLYSEDQIIQHLLPLKEAVPDLLVTAYTIPGMLGPVHDLAAKYDWITFATHGWLHTTQECRAWSYEDTVHYLSLAREMGYAPLFKAPNWTLNEEVEAGLKDAGVLLHAHPDHLPSTPGLLFYSGPYRGGVRHHNLHTHIARNPSTDFIATHPHFTPAHLSTGREFTTPIQLARTI